MRPGVSLAALNTARKGLIAHPSGCRSEGTPTLRGTLQRLLRSEGPQGGPGLGVGSRPLPPPHRPRGHFKVGAQLVKDLRLYLFFFLCSKLDILL